jgi:hypothetical protein
MYVSAWCCGEVAASVYICTEMRRGQALANKRARIRFKTEPWAKMAALAECADMSETAVDTDVKSLFATDQHFRGLAATWTPNFKVWPEGNHPDLVAIGACHVMKKKLPKDLVSEAGANSDDVAAAKNLYNFVFRGDLDYWALTKKLGTDKATRDWLAMEGGCCRPFVWPKKKSQFFFGSHLPYAVNECDQRCRAIVGAFVIDAALGHDTTINASAYYLLTDGNIHYRGQWNARTFGIDERKISIHYTLTYPRLSGTSERSYDGFISIQRNNSDPVIGALNFRGTRCFDGHIYTLLNGDLRCGPFFVEEMSSVHDNENAVQAVLKSNAYEKFIQRMAITTASGVCRWCPEDPHKRGYVISKCAFTPAP